MTAPGIPERASLPAEIVQGRIVAIGRRLAPGIETEVGEALAAAGVCAFEVTLNEPMEAPLRAIGALRRKLSGRLLVGAGTVLDIDAAARAVDEGAEFLVCPHTDPTLITWAVARGVPILPGAMTPSEVVRAWTAGATAVKLFPASVVGPRFLRELRGPLPDVPLLPTGGIDATNAGAFVAAGAVAVGLGSWLIGDAVPDGVAARAAAVRTAIDAALAPPDSEARP